eukprot:1667681-Rhodomonas_salina.1
MRISLYSPKPNADTAAAHAYFRPCRVCPARRSRIPARMSRIPARIRRPAPTRTRSRARYSQIRPGSSTYAVGQYRAAHSKRVGR